MNKIKISPSILSADFGNLQKELEAKKLNVISAEFEWIPGTTVPVTDEQAEEISKLINVSSTKLLPNATSNDLAIMILNITASLEKKLPNDIAIEFIKKEVRKLF